jgi:hypothetical protein
MFDAERVIDDAFQSFFDIGNMGLLKVEMEKVGHGEMFDAVFYSRMNRAQSDKKEFYQFMLSFTPERLRKTRKFKEMDDKYSNITA